MKKNESQIPVRSGEMDAVSIEQDGEKNESAFLFESGVKTPHSKTWRNFDEPSKSRARLGVRRFYAALDRPLATWIFFITLLLNSAHNSRAISADHHDTVVILLDASGSMKTRFKGTEGSRMDAAKSALRTVIKKIPQTTQVGLLVFSSANLTNDWAFPIGPRDDKRLFEMLDSIECRTDTPLGKYMKTAADSLLAERAKHFGYGTYRLLIVTDGEAQDANLVNRYTPEIIARGITVDVIGVAMNRAHTLANKVHSYRSANDSSALNQALSEVFAEVRGSANDNAGAEVFATIAPLPDSVANAMIQAVATLPNQPIGEIAKVSMPVPQNSQTKQAPPQAMATPQPQAPVQVQPQPSAPYRRRRPLSWPMIIGILIVLSFFRRSRGGGRR